MNWEVMEGDALSLLDTLAPGSVDAVITDPPYSSGGMFRGDRAASTDKKYTSTESQGRFADFEGDSRDQMSWGYWSALWLSAAHRVAKLGAPIVTFCDWRQLSPAVLALQAGGWIYRGVAVWDKSEAARPRLGGFRAQAEFMIWGSKGPLPARPDVGTLPGVVRVYAPGDKYHQAGKPLELMREIVKICPADGLILDPFGGSGSTGVAALQTGRRALICEITAHWAQVCRARLQACETGAEWGGNTTQLGLLK